MKLFYIPGIVLDILHQNTNPCPPSDMTFRFPIAIILLAIGITVSAAIASMVAHKRHQSRRRVLIFLYIALVAGLLFAPALIASKIVVAADHLEETIGFWPFEGTNYFAYCEVEFIRPGSDVVNGSPRRMWHVQDVHGQWMHIQLDNLWELHESAIKTCLQQHGIAFRE